MLHLMTLRMLLTNNVEGPCLTVRFLQLIRLLEQLDCILLQLNVDCLCCEIGMLLCWLHLVDTTDRCVCCLGWL